MSVDQGLDVVKKCIHELRTRFLISQPKFLIKLVDKQGIREVPLE